MKRVVISLIILSAFAVATFRVANLHKDIQEIRNDVDKTRNVVLTYKQEVQEISRPDEQGYVTRKEYKEDIRRLSNALDDLIALFRYR